MGKQLRDRYNSYEDEKLFSTLTFEKGKFPEGAIPVIIDILKERGYKVDLKQEFVKKYNNHNDEDLITIIENDYEKYQPIAIEAIEDILQERGFSIEDAPVEKKQDSIPLLLGIFLLIANLFIFAYLSEYQMTETNSTFLGWANDFKFAYIIGVRILVISMIIHYRKKQEGKYIMLWALAGLLFGSWALIAIGVVELLTKYPLKKKPENSLELTTEST